MHRRGFIVEISVEEERRVDAGVDIGEPEGINLRAGPVGLRDLLEQYRIAVQIPRPPSVRLPVGYPDWIREIQIVDMGAVVGLSLIHI